MINPQAQSGDETRQPETPNESELSRRVFNRLSMAAFSGLVAGSIVGCGGGEEENGGGAPTGGGTGTGGTGTDTGGGGTETTDSNAEPFSWVDAEKHVCRGLNACEGKGAGGDNACAGQGTCATVAHIACAGQNECKGQGGCGEHPGENACRGQGGCHVPLHEGMWVSARARFEEAMTAAGKEFGDAPAAL